MVVDPQFSRRTHKANKDIKMMDSVHLIPERDRVIFQRSGGWDTATTLNVNSIIDPLPFCYFRHAAQTLWIWKVCVGKQTCWIMHFSLFLTTVISSSDVSLELIISTEFYNFNTYKQLQDVFKWNLWTAAGRLTIQTENPKCDPWGTPKETA